MILIVGGTGAMGSAAVERLLAEGERVRVMTRAPEKAAGLGRAGAEVVQGDLLDRGSLSRACRGVEKVITAAHSLFGRGKEASVYVDGRGQRDLIEAARAAGVRHFVYTSVLSYGPAYDRIPFFRIKQEVEKYLAASGLDYTILRPTAFMEAHAHLLIGAPIVQKGKVALFGRGETPRNFVAADDVAGFAVRALRDRGLSKQTLAVGGPQNLSNMDVVRLYERLSGRPAKVLHLPLAPLNAHPFVRLFHPGASQVLQTIILGETTDQTFDAGPLQRRFGVALRRLEEWAAERVQKESATHA